VRPPGGRGPHGGARRGAFGAARRGANGAARRGANGAARRGAFGAALPAALAAALLAALPVAAPRPALAQEEVDLTAALRTLKAAFDRAREHVDNLDFTAAARELGTIIEPRKTRKAADLGREEMEILAAALDMRARALFNLGNVKAAEADFETLLRLEPSYVIDRQTLSPKVVDLFDRVRKRVAALLVLTLEPPRARLTVDGDEVEPDETGRLAVLAGRRVLKVEHEGFDPHEEVLSVVAGVEVPKSIRLRPNRRALQFVTAPAGVTVLVDGIPAGTTRGPATPEAEALAAQHGLDPRLASAPLLVPLVTPGDHKVTFEMECYQAQTVSVRVAIDPENNAPLRFPPVVLREARVDLRVASIPSGADVFVDGERRGTTPLTLTGLCGGERDILIARGDAGAWNERIRLQAGQVNVLEARLRPTLLYAGTFRLDEWGRAVWSDEDKPLLDELARGLKTLNLVRAPEALQAVRDAVIKWLIAEPNEARAGVIVPPAVLREAATKTRADLVLAGLTLAGDPDKTWTLNLYSVHHPSPDTATLRLDRPQGARDFVRRLDAAPPASAPWWGMGIADTLVEETKGGAGAGGPIVVRVLAGSPAAKAGVRVGDRIRMVGSRSTASVADVRQAIAREMARPGGLRPTIAMGVDDGAGPRTVRLTPGDGPVVIPLTDPDLLYNRALAEFRLRARGAEDPAERGVAYLNLGVAYMHFRHHDRAQTEGFARAELPAGPGISEGTVLYYRALCALRRGDPGAARAAFETAAGRPGSTLDDGDGPSAAAAAARMLKALQ
jgi:soluble cytochrome b562